MTHGTTPPRSAVVTGAWSGIGEATARAPAALAAKGHRVEPGVVATGLPHHITHDQTRQSVQELHDAAEVTATDVAEVEFVLSRPRHLAVNEVLLRPAGQL